LAEPWGPLVQRANQALLEGRFKECERLAAEAARFAPGDPRPGLLAVAARREQGRAAEAEPMARDLVAAHPDIAEVQALLGAVLADLGRDGEAGRQLDLVDVQTCSVEAAALAAEVAAVVYLPGPAEELYTRLAPRAGELVPTTGAVARHVALLEHILDRWDPAAAHFEAALQANEAARAPVLVAHTRRQYSALLRVRGDDGDWERAIELLTDAAAVYRRLEIDPLAEESEAVLRRSQDPGGDAAVSATPPVFRRTAEGWQLSFAGRSATVADSPGLGHVATLLAADGRPVHVVDLALGSGASLHEQMVAEYRARVADLDAQLAGGCGEDRAAAALARAERDFLLAELAIVTAGAPAAGEVGDRARRLVALRIRIALDRLDAALPALARHLRRGIRTGTFCLYEPDGPERWTLGR
jgi:tetratricopeptide (TPR) repeat protein